MRKAIIAAGIILATVIPVARSQAPQSTHPDMSDAQNMLQYMEERDNREIYHGALSPVTVHYLTPLPDLCSHDVACTLFINGHFHIYIDSYYHREIGSAYFSMLHEECHVYLPWHLYDPPRGHGPKFQACMHHLADIEKLDFLW
jgi:hypothetical protein